MFYPFPFPMLFHQSPSNNSEVISRHWFMFTLSNTSGSNSNKNFATKDLYSSELISLISGSLTSH